MDWVRIVLIGLFVLVISYGAVGVGTRVDSIKSRAPQEIAERNWDILRYEGYQYGSFHNHGGKVWYHVRNKDNHSVQYRVYVTLWGGELHYQYGAPEKLSRFDVDTKDLM